MGLEYEGAWHTTRIREDRRRIEALQAARWRAVFVTAADLQVGPRAPAELSLSAGWTQAPRHTGVRFSAKARAPSSASAEENTVSASSC